MPSKYIQVVTNAMISFFLVAEYFSILYVHHIFIHSSIIGHLGCSHGLAVGNSVAMNTGMHISSWEGDFISFRFIPRSGIAGSDGSFKFFEEISHCFPWWLFNTGTRASFSPHAHQQLFLDFFFLFFFLGMPFLSIYLFILGPHPCGKFLG